MKKENLTHTRVEDNLKSIRLQVVKTMKIQLIGDNSKFVRLQGVIAMKIQLKKENPSVNKRMFNSQKTIQNLYGCKV